MLTIAGAFRIQVQAMATLTNKQRLFVEAYLANGMNATQAALEAGYSPKTAYSQGQRLLKNVEAVAEIQRRLDQKVMSANESLELMSEMARISLDDILTVPGTFPYVDIDKARRLGKMHLIKKIKVRGDGGIEVEMYDRQRANETMMRHHGLLKDGDTYNFNVSVTLVFEAVAALEASGIDATEFFEKAKARALERKRALNGG